MKSIFLVTVLITFRLIFTPLAYTQGEVTPETEFENAYKEYQLQMDEYQEVHEEYILRRSQYLRFGTLKSQQDARDATVAMLQVRDDVMVLYLIAVSERLHEARGLEDARREGLTLRINEEIGWFKDHRGKIPSAGTLEDLEEDSDEAKKRFDLVEPLIFEVLSTISSGKLGDIKGRLKDIQGSLKEKIEEIKSEEREEYSFSERKLQILDRWIFEADNRIVRGDEKQVEADAIILTFGSPKANEDWLTIYNDVLIKLAESQQFFKEASSFMKEIVREVKTKE